MEATFVTMEREVTLVGESQVALEQKIKDQHEDVRTVKLKVQQFEKVIKGTEKELGNKWIPLLSCINHPKFGKAAHTVVFLIERSRV